MKRAWMLLLAVIALVALMTIPAMAAETHEHTTALEAGAVTISQSGTYYLEGDTAVSVSVTAGEVTICLNGANWTNGTGTRPLTVSGSAKLTLCDCAAAPGNITGSDVSAGFTGTLAGNYYGGAIHISGGSLTVKNISITGGQALKGGAFYVSGGTVKITGTKDKPVTINGGTVVSIPQQPKTDKTDKGAVNNTGSGGAFFVTAGTVEAEYCVINGGLTKRYKYSNNGTNDIITDDVVDYTTIETYSSLPLDANGGSAFFINGTGKVTVNHCTLNGQTVHSSKRGGTIYMANQNAKLYLKDSEITATNSNINASILYVESGEAYIQDDSVLDASNMAEFRSGGITYGCAVSMTGSSSKIFLQKGEIIGYKSTGSSHGGGTVYISGGKFTMSGGRIYGGVHTNTNSNSGGGNLAVAGGTFEMSGGIIGSDSLPTASQSRYGGNVFVKGGTFKMTSGTIQYGRATASGGSMYIIGGTVELSGGTIKEGLVDSGSGGNLYCKNSSTVKISGSAMITKGTCTNGNGGNIRLDSPAQMELSGNAKITEGNATRSSTNGSNGNGGNLAVYGSFKMTGGLISGGNVYQSAKNILVNNKTAHLELLGGTIDVYVNVSPTTEPAEEPDATPTLILGGDIKIVNPTAGQTSLWISKQAKTTGGTDYRYVRIQFSETVPLTGDARIVLSTESDFAGRILSTEAVDFSKQDLSGLSCMSDSYYLGISATEGEDLGKLCLIQDDAATPYVALGVGDVLMPLNDAITKAGANGHVRLIKNLENQTIAANAWVDLDGFNMTGATLAEGATLRLFDSKTADYTVADGDYGKLTLAEGSKGTVERAFVTGDRAGYGHNYRFLVVKDAQGTYSSHRIYLAVKSTVLYPAKPALNYRTALRCDEVVADYINKEGGAYGLRIGAEGYNPIRSDYLGEDYAVVATAGDENLLISQLQNILELEYALEQQKLYTETTLNACAYIQLTDSFGGEEITSSSVNKSFKDVVVETNANESLTVVQKSILGRMYNSYTALMEPWNANDAIGQIVAAANDQSALGVIYHCLCGDPTSKNNPCANEGHKHLAWVKWDKTDALPKESGNYYLTGDVIVEKQTDLISGQKVCLDTMGFDITNTNHRIYRTDKDGVVLNISNSKWATDQSILSATGPAYSANSGGGDGAVLILGTGTNNVSLYKGLRLQQTESHNATQGGIITQYGGYLNIYGAEIVASSLVSSAKAQCGMGGAVYISGGELYMNSGKIVGCAAKLGGAIYSGSKVTITGTARIEGAVCLGNPADEPKEANKNSFSCDHSRGGAIYVNKGTFVIDGEAVVDGGQACHGGTVYIEGGQLTMENGTIQNGDARGTAETYTFGEKVEVKKVDEAYGGNIYVGENGTFVMNDGLVTLGEAYTNGGGGGLGGNICANGKVELLGGEVTEGKSTTGGNIGLNSKDSDVLLSGVRIAGGESVGGHGGNINMNVRACKSCIIDEGTMIENGVASTHGGNISISVGTNSAKNAVITMLGGTVRNGTANTTSGYGGNIYVYSSTAEENKRAQFNLQGGTISGGMAGSGGSIMVTGQADLFISKPAEVPAGYVEPTISGGAATAKQGGNVYVATNATFEMSCGTLTGGMAKEIGGNIYLNGTVNISGGIVENGRERWDYLNNKYVGTDNAGANIASVNGDIYISGGWVKGHISANSYGSDNSAPVIISGSAKVIGDANTGVNLASGKKTDGSYYQIPAFSYEDIKTLDPSVTKVVVRVSGFNGYYKDGLMIMAFPEEGLEEAKALAQQIFGTFGGACKLVIDDTGVWLKPVK